MLPLEQNLTIDFSDDDTEIYDLDSSTDSMWLKGTYLGLLHNHREQSITLQVNEKNKRIFSSLDLLFFVLSNNIIFLILHLCTAIERVSLWFRCRFDKQKQEFSNRNLSNMHTQRRRTNNEFHFIWIENYQHIVIYYPFVRRLNFQFQFWHVEIQSQRHTEFYDSQLMESIYKYTWHVYWMSHLIVNK